MLRASRWFYHGSGLFLFSPSSGARKNLEVSLACLPPHVESKHKGILVDFDEGNGRGIIDGKITWDVVPFPRSLDNVEKGRADFHVPYITP